jgi:hypothetical protein
MLVILRASIIDAGLTSTLGEELLLRVVVEQYINVALDLLGGRPIDLAVFLQALLLNHKLLVLHPTVCLALVIREIASICLALTVLTQALFEVLLNHVAFQIHLQERMI